MLTHQAAGDLRRLVLIALFIASSTASRAGAADLADGRGPAAGTQAAAAPSPTPRVAEPEEANASERRTLGRFFPNVGRSFVGVFSKPTMAPLLIGGSLAGLGSFLDDDIHKSAAKDSLGDAGDTAGGPVVSLSVATALFIGGRFAKEGRFRSMTYDLGVGTLVNAGYTELIKVAVGRERPDQSDNKSFPSGHTSHSFMVATVVQKHYGWKLGAPMYVFAGFVGYSRLNKDKHWFSDVLTGATLGYISGITVVRQNDKPVPARRSVTLVPILGSHRRRGLQVAVTFH